MQTLRVLHVAPELAPLSGEGDNAEAAEMLCRGLCSLGHRLQVTAATLHDPERAPERWGIARRLEPVEVAGDAGRLEVPVWEGLLPDGCVQALVADCDPAPEPVEVLARLALGLARDQKRPPHVVHTWDTAPHAALVAHSEASAAGQEPPAVVLSLSDPGAPLNDPLREALAVADQVVVSSPTVAREIAGSGGELARAVGDPAKLRGIVHGIDEVRFSPERDSHLPRTYGTYDLAEKAAQKRELQRELGLPPRASRPLIGAVGRFDLLARDTIEALADADVQLALIVDPVRDVDAAAELIALAKRQPTRIAAREISSSSTRTTMTHRLLAGADLWLLPRAPTPRGFLELHCLAYGTLPIAPRAGAFADVLVDCDPTTATGSGFLFSPDGGEIPATLRRAARAFEARTWPQLVERGMQLDLSWRTAARRYADVYLAALRRRRGGEGRKVDRVVA